MKKYILTSLVAVVILASCSKEPSVENGKMENPTQFIQERISKTHIDEVSVNFAGSRYLDHYAPADFTAGISAVKENPLAEIVAYSFNKRYETCSYASDLPKDAKPFRITVSGLDLSSALPPTRTTGNPLGELFGRKNTFKITELLTTRQGDGRPMESSSEEISLYIPRPIEITTPAITSDEDFYPFCYSKDFVLRWNADPNNENGVIIVVEWFGATAGQGDYNAHIRRIDLLEDTGEAHLDAALFDGIPNTALVDLTLLRGDVKNIDLDNCTYKISGETHAYLSLVLVTKIKEKTHKTL